MVTSSILNCNRPRLVFLFFAMTPCVRSPMSSTIPTFNITRLTSSSLIPNAKEISFAENPLSLFLQRKSVTIEARSLCASNSAESIGGEI
jgi:hypothetical protein